jgi:hypothetical protein
MMLSDETAMKIGTEISEATSRFDSCGSHISSHLVRELITLLKLNKQPTP